MTKHVGEGFLHHTVGGQVSAGWQRPGRAADPELDRQPGCRYPRDQGVEPGEPGLRTQRPLTGAARRRAEQPEQVPQFGHRGPAAGLDGEQRVFSVAR